MKLFFDKDATQTIKIDKDTSVKIRNMSFRQMEDLNNDTGTLNIVSKVVTEIIQGDTPAKAVKKSNDLYKKVICPNWLDSNIEYKALIKIAEKVFEAIDPEPAKK